MEQKSNKAFKRHYKGIDTEGSGIDYAFKKGYELGYKQAMRDNGISDVTPKKKTSKYKTYKIKRRFNHPTLYADWWFSHSKGEEVRLTETTRADKFNLVNSEIEFTADPNRHLKDKEGRIIPKECVTLVKG